MYSNSLAGAAPEPVSTRTGASYLDATIYIFNSLSKPETGKQITVRQALELIQESDYSVQIRQARQFGKGHSEYDVVKKNIPCFAWNVSSLKKHHRKTGNVQELSGLMFFDRDTIGDISELNVIPELVCSYTSFGGLGDGYIVAVDGLTTHNYKSTWQALQERYKSFGLDVDASCSDIARANVLSYSEVFLQDEVIPFKAVEPTQITKPERPKNGVIQDEDKTYTYLKQWLDNRGDYFVQGGRNSYIVKLAGACNRCGLAQSNVESWLINEFEETGFTADEIRKTVAYIYAKSSSDFGVSPMMFEEKSERKNGSFSGKKGYVLHDADSTSRAMVAAGMNDTFESDVIKKTTYESVIVNRYLSEFELPGYQYLIVSSPTGTGKGVVFLRQKNKRILLVPYITLAKNLAASKDGVKAGAKAVYEGVQVSPLDKVLIGTYETISKVIDQLELSQYELWVDEAHNFIQSSSRAYREKALNLISNYFDKFGRVILLSGTWIPTTLGPFSKFHFIHVASKSKAPATINIIPTRNRLKSVVKRIKENKSGLHLVYIKGRTKCVNWAKTLSDLGYGRFVPINADTKLLSEQSSIIESGVLPEGVRGLVINDAAKEGVSLEDQAQYFVHFPYSTDSITTEQVLNRPRTFAPVVFCYVTAPTETATFHINPMTETKRLTYTSNRLQREQELLTFATKQASWIESRRFFYLANDSYIPAQDEWDNDRKNEKFAKLIKQVGDEYIGVDVPRNVDDEVKVNELVIANQAYKELCIEEIKTPELYIANLESYGHTIIIQSEIDENDENDALSKSMKANAKDENTKQHDEAYRILAELEQCSMTEVKKISKDTKNRFKSSLAEKWLYLHKHLADTSEIVDVLKKNYKPRQWNRYYNQLDFCLHLNGRMKATERKKKQIDYFVEQIKTGDTEYTPEEIQAIIIKAQKKIYRGKSNDKMTTTLAVQTMKVFFQLEDTRKADQRLYKIVKCGAIKEKLLPLKSEVTVCNTL
jgi:hypothetical protein